MLHWSTTERGKKFVESAFKAADLPEIDEANLELGTYTNQQIAEKINKPESLLALLMNLSGGDNASRRSILSFAVDMID